MTALVVAALAGGVLSGWVFSRATNMIAARALLRRIHGHFLEFRLFFDEPALIWRAQKDLFLANMRLLRLLLPPTLILALPTAWLMIQLNDVYSAEPLKIGAPAVVTAQLATDLQPQDAKSVLQSPLGIDVETEPLRVVSDRQVVWRIRPRQAVSGDLHFTLRGVSMTKTITASPSHGLVFPRRERPFWTFLMHPEEGRLPAGGVQWLEVDYPKRGPWWIVWFLAISSVSALAFLRWF